MREPALPGRRGDPRCSVLVCALVLQLGWMEGELALSVRQTVLGVRLFWSRCVCARGRAAGTRFTCWRDVCAQSARLWAERATSGTGARNTKACCGYPPLPPAPPFPSRSVPSVFFQVKADLLNPPPPSLALKGVRFLTQTGEEDEAVGESAEGGGGPGRLRFSAVLVSVSAGPAGGEPELFIAASALIGFMSRGCRHRGSLRLCLASWKSSVCTSVHAHTCARAFD